VAGTTTDSGETTCQPTKTPTILLCDTVAVGPNGERKHVASSNSSTKCENLQELYGNFRPSLVQFRMVSEFVVDITNASKPNFIVESKFGITDSLIRIKHMKRNGTSSLCNQW